MMLVEDHEWFDRADAIARSNGNPRNLGGISSSCSVPANVDHGRWIVHCPCGSARMTAPGVLFWCPDCGNQWAGRDQVPVVWPPADVKALIEALLDVRALPDRFWLVGETVEDLASQNQVLGLPVFGVVI